MDPDGRGSRHSQPVTRRSFLAGVVVSPTWIGFAAGRARGQKVDPPREGNPAGRLDAMRWLAGGVKVSEVVNGQPGRPIPLRPEPLLRYSDPPRHIHDSTLWAWGETGRPRAILKIEHMPLSDDPHRWVHGVAALAAGRIEVEFRDGRRWRSSRPGLELVAIPGAPAPAGSGGLRLGQLKEISRRFSASEIAGPARGRLQLRLMPRPLLRYDGSGARDGAIFGIAYGTNPSVLLAIEAREDDGDPGWRYGLARHGDGDFTVTLDGRDVWKQPPIGPLPASLPTYMNRWVPASDEAK